MKVLLAFLFVFSLALIPLGSEAQKSNHWCGTHIVNEAAMQNSQEFRDSQAELERFTRRFIKDYKPNKSGRISATIPVVVHIVHENGVENIPAANVADMMEDLNQYYQKTNPDTAQVVAAFQGIIGDMDIQFRLATKDPNGNCTNGITRTFDPTFTNSGVGTRPIGWPRSQYLNIWVVKDINLGGGSVIAYSQYPANASPNADGVVCRYEYIGTLPPSANNNDTRTTMAHEVGHWLNLRHPWGNSNNMGLPSNCNTDDGITDTPNTIGAQFACNTNQVTCGSLDNVQNLMDYGACSHMFTQGQVAWMTAALNSSVGQRNSLFTPSNLIATGTDDNTYNNPPTCPPSPDFVANKTLDCEGSVISFTDRSFHAFANPSTFTYSWSFPGGTPSTSTSQNPQITYDSVGLFPVTLNVSVPGVTGSNFTRTDFIEILPGSGTFIAPYTEKASDPSWPNSSDPSLVWSRVKPTSSLFQFQRTTAAFFSPPASIFLNNFSFNGSGDFELNTPPVDMSNLSGSAYLKFRFAHRKRANENELIQLWASTNCGESFSLVRIINSNLLSGGLSTPNAFVPADTSEWSFRAEDVSSFAGEPNVIFSFRFGANGGNNLYLDDISVSDNPNPEPITALDNEFEESFSLYPNPNEGQFRLDFYWDGNDAVNATIVDIVGKEISLDINEEVFEGWNSLNIDARELGLESGVYFLNLNSGESNFTKRVIIK